jgi:3-oxoacyl-[acyl-carrier-protein] synthase II
MEVVRWSVPTIQVDPTMNSIPQVCVTGLGAVTPLGEDLAATWNHLISGKDAMGDVTLFDVSGCRCRVAAEIKSIKSAPKSRLTRGSQMAMTAVREALSSAFLLTADEKSKIKNLPISVSTTGGGMSLGEAFYKGCIGKGDKIGQLYRASRYQAQAQILDLQKHFGFSGPVTIIANACASGANAIGHAADLIRTGMCDCVLTGGYEELTELIYVGFDCLQALTTERCRPFDQKRSGLILGEAAGFLVLESRSHAENRGAKILCELKGYGHSTDLHHLTQPHPSGKALVQAMSMALKEAKIQPDEIGYVNAHGTATKLNDESEAAAFNEIFNACSSLPKVSSTKASIGHTLGAAGAIEAVFSIQALLSRALPPQLNLIQPESLISERLVRANEKKNDLRSVMSTNLGFGGSNAALIFEKYEA